jgi:hypothetical protein
MGAFLFGLVAGSGLTWAFMGLRRDGYWREFNARRRGSNPPPPGRKPAPPAGPPDVHWMRSFTHECTNPPTGAPPLKLRRQDNWKDEQVYGSVVPAQVDLQPAYAAGVAAERDRLRADAKDWSSEALNAATGAMIESYRRHTGQSEALIFYNNAKRILRDALGAYFNEGQTQRGNSDGGPTTPKPPIKPQPHGGYQPRPSNRTPNPPPSEP